MSIMTDKERRRVLSSMTLWNDHFFTKCFSGDRESASLLLKVLLDRDDLKVGSVRTQEWIESIEGLSVRLDVLANDAEGNIYNIEIQKDEGRAKRKRARYYSSMIDAGCLGKGKDYDELPESFVIFITHGDIIGDGKAMYEIERMVKGDMKPFGDGSHIVYVSADLADRSTRLGKLMHDMECSDPREMYYTTLRKRVSYFKETKEGMTDMADEFDAILKRVKKESEERNSRKLAKNMLAEGSIPVQTIAKISELPIEEVESIKNSMHV